MNLKRILGYGLSLVLVCGALMGCSNSSDTSSTTDNAGTETSAQTQAKPETKGYQAGTRTDKQFTSEWLGIKYNLSEGMIMMTDEQIQQAMQIGSENMYEDPNTGQKLIDYANLNTVYEMAATKADTGESIVMLSEKMSITLNEDQYVEALKAQLKGTTMSPVYKDVKTRNVAGIDFTDLSYSITQNGQKLNQTMLLKRKDDRMVSVAITYTNEETFNKILAGFEAI